MLALDLDGTIISCKERQSSLMRDIVGIGFDVDRYWFYKQNGDNNKTALIKLGYGAYEVNNFCRAWLEKIETFEYLKLDKLLIDILDLSSRFSLVLITARSNEKKLHEQLEYLNIIDCFKKIYVVNPRNAAVEKANILKAIDCRVFIGDSESDFEAANLADVDFMGVLSGQRSSEFWSNIDINPNMLFPSLVSIYYN
jgi:phosphoglycolate phosphatase-like HAD superfamily hydrolase